MVVVQVKVQASFNEEMMEPEVRRFSFNNEEATSFAALVAKIQNLFPRLQGQEFEVFWVDDELDQVILSNDEDLVEAVRVADDKDEVLDVMVNTLEDGEPEEQDVCQECLAAEAVFECSPCDNVKLCTECKENEVHKEHELKRIQSSKKPIFCGRFCKHRRFHQRLMGPRCIRSGRGGMMGGRGGIMDGCGGMMGSCGGMMGGLRAMMGPRGSMMGGHGGMMGGRGGMMGGRGGMMGGLEVMMGRRGSMMGGHGGMMGGRRGMMGERGGMMGGHGGMMGPRGGMMGGCGGMMGPRGMMGGHEGMMGPKGSMMGGHGGMMGSHEYMMGPRGGMMGGCEDMSTRGCMMRGRGCMASLRQEMVA